ncbi:hypothetical protein [Bifidobacterium psychraerophilum]|nr:hypothetical protein [Bifidobacterium psychraerophilum]
MSSSDNAPSMELVPVKFSRLTRRGILLGLSSPSSSPWASRSAPS